MRRTAVALIALAGCGRISFDAFGAGAGDGGIDSNRDAPDAKPLVIPPGAGVWLEMETGPAAGSGGIVDSAGGHSATCAGTCPAKVAGLHGSGYQFGTEEIQVAYAADLAAGGGFTAALWIRFSTPPSAQGCVWSQPFGAMGSGFDTFTLCIDPDLTVTFDSESPGGVANALSAPALSLNSWHHLAFTWDGAIKRGYVDGVKVVQGNVQIGTGNRPLSLGGEDGGYFVEAVVDDAVFYPRALSAAEVSMLATP